MPTKDDFVAELDRVLSEAASRDMPVIDVNAGWLHRRLGGYPGRNHAMPTCCDVLYGEMKVGDEILSRPPRGEAQRLPFGTDCRANGELCPDLRKMMLSKSEIRSQGAGEISSRSTAAIQSSSPKSGPSGDGPQIALGHHFPSVIG